MSVFFIAVHRDHWVLVGTQRIPAFEGSKQASEKFWLPFEGSLWMFPSNVSFELFSLNVKGSKSSGTCSFVFSGLQKLWSWNWKFEFQTLWIHLDSNRFIKILQSDYKPTVIIRLAWTSDQIVRLNCSIILLDYNWNFRMFNYSVIFREYSILLRTVWSVFIKITLKFRVWMVTESEGRL